MQNASTYTSKTRVGQTFFSNNSTFSDKSQEAYFDKKNMILYLIQENP